MFLTEFFLLGVPEISDDEFNSLLTLVSPNRAAKVQRLKARDKQLQSLFAKLLLRAVLCDRLKVQNTELEFAVLGKGKPYLKSNTDVHFSMSHTDSLVAVAVSSGEVGIDVEAVRSADPKLCERFFTKSEQEFVAAGTPDWLKRFYAVWTRKEAYLKYTGKGLSTPLSSFSTVENDDRYHTTVDEIQAVTVYCSDKPQAVPNDRTRLILERFIQAECGVQIKF